MSASVFKLSCSWRKTSKYILPFSIFIFLFFFGCFNNLNRLLSENKCQNSFAETPLSKQQQQKKHKNVTKSRKMKNLFNSRHGLAACILIIQHREGESNLPDTQMCRVSQNRFRAHCDGTEHKWQQRCSTVSNMFMILKHHDMLIITSKERKKNNCRT